MHDLMVLILEWASVDRLLASYDYLKDVRSTLVERGILIPEEGRLPRVELPLSVPVALHSSACADGSGWDLASCDEWTALPAAFDVTILGSAYPGKESEARLQPALQLCQRYDVALLRVHTNRADEGLPEFFESEALPIEELHSWRQERRWNGGLVINEETDYGDC